MDVQVDFSAWSLLSTDRVELSVERERPLFSAKLLDEFLPMYSSPEERNASAATKKSRWKALDEIYKVHILLATSVLRDSQVFRRNEELFKNSTSKLTPKYKNDIVKLNSSFLVINFICDRIIGSPGQCRRRECCPGRSREVTTDTG